MQQPVNELDPGLKSESAISIEAQSFKPSGPSEKNARFTPLRVILASLVLIAGGCFWFLFTSKSVQLIFSPEARSIIVEGGVSIELAGVWLLREGSYDIAAQADLYEPLNTEVVVTQARNQRINLVFTPLPGILELTTEPVSASVQIDGDNSEKRATLAAGLHNLDVTHPRYLPTRIEVDIEGRQIQQDLLVELQPNWANIAVVTSPPGARILIDDESWPEVTPTVIEALAGERDIKFQLDGHKTHHQRIFAKAEDRWSLDAVTLVQADAQLALSSVPSAAGIILNGSFVGKTPALVDLKSGAPHKLQLVNAGYADYVETIRLDRGAKINRSIRLKRQLGTVKVFLEPEHAVLSINGKPAPNKLSFNLPIENHTFRVELDGYAGFSKTIMPKNGIVQELKVRLLTLEEARLAALVPVITAPDGQRLKLFSPTPFTMGASRREPGRRANETLREITMKRLFYLATHETTNGQFRKFATGHDSDKYVDTTLNDDAQPVANLSWHDAAAYCNWLSEKQQIEAFYQLEFGKVIGTNWSALGYRLPTEAEWSWAARTPLPPATEQLRFPWGAHLPPPDRHANYADRAASNLVGRVIFGYNDNYAAASPIGTYKPNHHGLYDLGGNAAEWMNDYYEIPNNETKVDPWGPTSGEYHVIKGSSWMHGSVTELRYSFRDYAIDGRQDVGFRIARSAE